MNEWIVTDSEACIALAGLLLVLWAHIAFHRAPVRRRPVSSAQLEQDAIAQLVPGHTGPVYLALHSSPAPVCPLPPTGWYCTRPPGHEGPCAAHPLAGKVMFFHSEPGPDLGAGYRAGNAP